MSRTYKDLLNPCGYGFDPEITPEEYQDVIENQVIEIQKLKDKLRQLKDKLRRLKDKLR